MGTEIITPGPDCEIVGPRVSNASRECLGEPDHLKKRGPAGFTNPDRFEIIHNT